MYLSGVVFLKRLIFNEFLVSKLKYANKCKKIWGNIKYTCIFLYIFAMEKKKSFDLVKRRLITGSLELTSLSYFIFLNI